MDRDEAGTIHVEQSGACILLGQNGQIRQLSRNRHGRVSRQSHCHAETLALANLLLFHMLSLDQDVQDTGS